MVDGAGGLGSDGRVLGRLTEWKYLGWMKGLLFGGMEGSALVGRKGPGAGKEIVADRRGKSGRIWAVLEAL
jgi:hypothetical protein